MRSWFGRGRKRVESANKVAMPTKYKALVVELKKFQVWEWMLDAMFAGAAYMEKKQVICIFDKNAFEKRIVFF